LLLLVLVVLVCSSVWQLFCLALVCTGMLGDAVAIDEGGGSESLWV
jgi:hypothetical protein